MKETFGLNYKKYKNMKTIKGPAIFLAQFVDKKAPFNSYRSR